MDTSFRYKCLELWCNDFSAVSNIDNVNQKQSTNEGAYFFQEDWTNEERVEDEIIAWTEYKFIELYKTNITEPNYLALFPMVKVSGDISVLEPCSYGNGIILVSSNVDVGNRYCNTNLSCSIGIFNSFPTKDKYTCSWQNVYFFKEWVGHKMRCYINRCVMKVYEFLSIEIEPSNTAKRIRIIILEADHVA